MPEGPDGAAAPPAPPPSDDAPAGDLGITVALDQFSGPMDLLLYLVRKSEVDIKDLPITAIADQFATWVATAAASGVLDLDSAGDFVVMAASLLEIKARMVAPPPEGTQVADDGEDVFDPRQGLIRKLLVYRAAKEAAFDLDRRDDERRLRHERGHREVVPDDEAEVDAWELKDVDVGALATLWFDLLKRIDSGGPRTVIVDDVPMGVRMARLVEDMRARGEGRMSELFALEPGAIGRVGIVMALLECTRQRMLLVRQGEQYGDVHIRFRPEEDRAMPSGDPGPPEQLPKRQRRPPLVTWSGRAGAPEMAEDAGGEPGDEPPVENEEQRFLRELESTIGVERLLGRAADLELGFIAWWEETHPGEPLPPGVVKPAPPPPPPPPEPKPEPAAAADAPVKPKRMPPRPRQPAAETPPAAPAAAEGAPTPGPLPEPAAVVQPDGLPSPATHALPEALPTPPVASFEVVPLVAPAAVEPPAPAAAVEAVAASPSEPAATMPETPAVVPAEPTPVATAAVEPVAATPAETAPEAATAPIAEPAEAPPEPVAVEPVVPTEAPPEPVAVASPHAVPAPAEAEPVAVEPAPATSAEAPAEPVAVEPAPATSAEALAEPVAVEPAPATPAEAPAEPVAVEPAPATLSETHVPELVAEPAPVVPAEAPAPVAIESAPVVPAVAPATPLAAAPVEPVPDPVAAAPAPLAVAAVPDAAAVTEAPPSEPEPVAAVPASPIAAAPLPVAVPPPPPPPHPPDGGGPTPPPTTRTPDANPTQPAPTTRPAQPPMSRPSTRMIAAVAALWVVATLGVVAWTWRPAGVLAVAAPDSAVVARDGEALFTLNLPLDAERLAEAPPIAVEPASAGRAAWRDARTAVFTASGLGAGEQVRIVFPERLRAQGGFRFAEAPPAFTLHALPAVAVSGEPVADLPAFGPGTIRLALSRAPADPAALLDALRIEPALPVERSLDGASVVLRGDFAPGTTYRVAIEPVAAGRLDDRPLAWTGELTMPARTSGARLAAAPPGRHAAIEAVNCAWVVVEAADGRRAVLHPGADGRATLPPWLLADGDNRLVLRWNGGETVATVRRTALPLTPAEGAGALADRPLHIVSQR